MYNEQWVSKSVEHLGHIIACTHKVKTCVFSYVWWKERQFKGNWWVKGYLKMEVVVSFETHLK